MNKNFSEKVEITWQKWKNSRENDFIELFIQLLILFLLFSDEANTRL